MPSGEFHRKRSKELFGDEFAEVHEFMDEPSSYLGIYHRILNHDDKAVEFVGRVYGDIAAKAARQHIIDDEQDTEERLKNLEEWRKTPQHRFWLFMRSNQIRKVSQNFILKKRKKSGKKARRKAIIKARRKAIIKARRNLSIPKQNLRRLFKDKSLKHDLRKLHLAHTYYTTLYPNNKFYALVGINFGITKDGEFFYSP